MELIAKIVMLASCAVCVLVQTVYFTHMMQLNSYRNERYRKWCKDHEEKVVNLRRLLPALLLPIMWLPGVYSYYAAGAVLLLTAGLNIPKKAKKPLVFTHRVWRLLGMQALLLLLVLTGAFFVDRMRSIGMAALYSLVVWVWTLVSNFLLGPLEKALANRYVKDARRRLEAMPGLLTIGVTGSYGKTSTKNFLHALLSVKYNVLMTPESYNTTLGVVRTIRESLRPTHQVLIAEMGAKTPATSGKSVIWSIPGTAFSPPSGNSISRRSARWKTSSRPNLSSSTPCPRRAVAFSTPTTNTSASGWRRAAFPPP